MNFADYTAFVNRLPKKLTTQQAMVLQVPMGFVELNDVLVPHPVIAKPIIPASPSSASTMVKCPKLFDARYVGKHVEKLQYVQSHHAVRGDCFHNGAENFMHGVGMDLMRLVEIEQIQAIENSQWTPEQLSFDLGVLEYWDKVLTAYRARFAPDKISIEEKFGYNDKTHKLGWWGRAVGMKSDLIISPTPTQKIYVDYKTGGKEYKGEISHDPFQLELTAQVLFKNHPEINQISAQLWYIDHKAIVHYLFLRDKPLAFKVGKGEILTPKALEYPFTMNQYWLGQKERTFDANPNYLCANYCDVMDCRHNGKN